MWHRTQLTCSFFSVLFFFSFFCHKNKHELWPSHGLGVGEYDLLSWELKETCWLFFWPCAIASAPKLTKQPTVSTKKTLPKPCQAVAQNKIIRELIIYLTNTFIQSCLQHSVRCKCALIMWIHKYPSCDPRMRFPKPWLLTHLLKEERLKVFYDQVYHYFQVDLHKFVTWPPGWDTLHCLIWSATELF